MRYLRPLRHRAVLFRMAILLGKLTVMFAAWFVIARTSLPTMTSAYSQPLQTAVNPRANGPSGPTVIGTGFTTDGKAFVDSIDDVPEYPGGTKERADCYEGFAGDCWYHLTTSDTEEQVINFYKDELVKSGWVIIDERDSFDLHRMEFVWENSVGREPTRGWLEVEVFPSNEYTSIHPGITQISVTFNRWPEPDKLPLYVDAKQIDVTWDAHEYPVDVELITSYLTHATTNELRYYYKDRMGRHGYRYTAWGNMPLGVMIPAQGPPDSLFSYHRATSTVAAFGSTILLYLQPQLDGRTKVELHASGYNVVTLYEERQQQQHK